MTDVNKTIKLDSAGVAVGGHGGHSGGEAPDEWHHHGAEEGEPQDEHLAQVNAFALVKWLVVIIAIVVVTVWGLAKLTQIVTDNLAQENALRVTADIISSENTGSRTALQAKSEMEMARPAHSLPGGAIAIPINDAMSKVLTKYEKGRSIEDSLPGKHGAIK